MQMGEGGRGERTASDRMPCAVYKHICIDRGLLSPAPLLFGFLMCSCPCPVCSLSKLYRPLCQPRLFDLSKFIPIPFAVCFSAFSDFFSPLSPWRAKSRRQQWGQGYFGCRYYDSSGGAARVPRRLLLACTV
jgi:hypothetical protein